MNKEEKLDNPTAGSLSTIQRTLMTHPLDTREKTLKTMLTDTGMSLRTILKTLWPKETNSQIKRDTSLYLSRREIYWPDIQQCWTHPDTEEKHSELKLNFFYANLHYLSARQHLRENNEHRAFVSLAHASNYIGFLEGYERRRGVYEIRQKRASKGGTEKALKKSKIKEHITAILKNCPKGGWGSESETIQFILNSEELKNFTSLIDSNYSKETLYNLITEEIITSENQNIYKKFLKK